MMASFAPNVWLHEKLPAENGYVIRPYVLLSGQNGGYYWRNGQKGFWRAFLASEKKYFTLTNTGRESNTNLESYISESFFHGKCRIDEPDLKAAIETYLHGRYFPNKPSNLDPITRKFGKYRGVMHNVGLDAHEIKLHCRFQNDDNDDKHVHLLNANDGKIEADGHVYYLQFEIEVYDPLNPLEVDVVELVKKRPIHQEIRKWWFVNHDEIPNIPIYEKHDEFGRFFVSTACHFVPPWLQNNLNDQLIALPDISNALLADEIADILPDLNLLDSNSTDESSCSDHSRTILNESELAENVPWPQRSTRSNMSLGSQSMSLSEIFDRSFGDNIAGPSHGMVNRRNISHGNLNRTPDLLLTDESLEHDDAISYQNMSNGSDHDSNGITNGTPETLLTSDESGEDRTRFDSTIFSSNRGEHDDAHRIDGSMRNNFHGVFDWTLEDNLTEESLDDAHSNQNMSHENDHDSNEIANRVPGTFLTSDESEDERTRFASRIDALTLTDADSDDEFDSDEANCRLIKDFIDKALTFLEHEKDLRRQENNIRDLFSNAADKEAMSSANLHAKGQTRVLRNLQIAKRFSSNTNLMCEEATKAREKYNSAVKLYSETKQMSAPIVSDQLKDSLFRTMFVHLRKKKKQNFHGFETAQELHQTADFEKIFNALIDENI